MQVSNSILPPHALASICMSPSKSTNRLGPLSSGSMPGLGQAVTPQFVYTQELGWTPVNPHALMQLQAQGGYFSQLAESAMQAVAHARHPFPASNTIQGNVDALASQYEHPQALHAAEVQPSATSQELVRPTAPISKRKRKRAAKAKSTPNPVKSDLGPFVYVHPSEEVLRAIRERALFHAPMCEPRRRVAQACEACRKRKIKCTGSRPACQRCTIRELECVYVAESRTTRVRRQTRVSPLLGLSQSPQQGMLAIEDELMDVDYPAGTLHTDAAVPASFISSLESSTRLEDLSTKRDVQFLAPPAPQHPQAMATRSLSAPAQGSSYMVDNGAVYGDLPAQAQAFTVPGPSQIPASYGYEHAFTLQSAAAYAAQQAQHTGLPPSRSSSMFCNYSQLPVMQQRSLSQPVHYGASGHYPQDPAHMDMVARSHTAPGEAAAQQQSPIFYVPRPPVQSSELEQRLTALSRETRGYFDIPPPLTRGSSAASSESGASLVQTPAEHIGLMASAVYKASGPGATAILDMLQMRRSDSVASAYSNPMPPPAKAGLDKVTTAGGVQVVPGGEDEQMFDFSKYFEGFSVSE